MKLILVKSGHYGALDSTTLIFDFLFLSYKPVFAFTVDHLCFQPDILCQKQDIIPTGRVLVAVVIKVAVEINAFW